MIQVLITVDTECSMGGAWEDPSRDPVPPERAILGKIGSAYHGIPLLMDLLERYDLPGVFFVEVFAGLNGFRQELAAAYSEIVRRGHDAQLHLHPIHLHYRMARDGQINPVDLPPTKDMIGTFPVQFQMEMLQKGIDLFREMTGKPPIAFRAGNFGAAMSTLEALEKVGIAFDSSFNAAYANGDCRIDSAGAINRPWQHGDLWEVPITTFQTGAWGHMSWKPLNINAVSLWEMTSVLEQAERLGLTAVTFIAHSFSLFKAADLQFHDLRPDWLVRRRFEGLCRFLRKNANRFRVVKFADLERSALSGPETTFPKMGLLIPALRKGVQAFNRLHWV
jgi:hypothetical protein